MSQEIEIGLGKKGRLGYALDDVAIVPSRRTRDPEDVSTSWQIDAYEFDVPVIGAPDTGTLGQITGGALEDSNVELSDQLVNLIVAQRNYQANAKTIETESAITQTIINLR